MTAAPQNTPIMLRPNHLKTSGDANDHNTPDCGIMRIHEEQQSHPTPHFLHI